MSRSCLSLLVFARLDLMRSTREAIPEDVSAFDRFGVLENGKEQAFFGLMPAQASDADAKKVVAKAKVASILHAGKRIVVLQGISTLPKEVTLVDRAAMYTTLRESAFAENAVLASWFGNSDRLVGTVTADDRSFLIKLGAP